MTDEKLLIQYKYILSRMDKDEEVAIKDYTDIYEVLDRNGNFNVSDFIEYPYNVVKTSLYIHHDTINKGWIGTKDKYFYDLDHLLLAKEWDDVNELEEYIETTMYYIDYNCSIVGTYYFKEEEAQKEALRISMIDFNNQDNTYILPYQSLETIIEEMEMI